MKLFGSRDAEMPKAEKSEAVPSREVVTECYCMNGHCLISDLSLFGDHPGITIKLRSATQEGLVSLSAIIGDKSRTFFNFNRVNGEIVDICCPTCSEALPIYNLCTCGAYLVALFSTPKADFANCIGICQRIGCLHAEIKSNRALRLYSRQGFF